MRHLLILISLIALGITAQAQQPTALTVAQAQEYAVKNAYSVKNSLLDVEIARKRIWENAAMGLPQIKSTIGYTDMMQIPTTLMPDFLSPSIYGVLIGEGLVPASHMPSGTDATFPVKFGTQHNANLDLSMSQLIFNGQYIVGLQAAKIFLQMSIQGEVKSEVDIKLNVAKSYYLVLIATENKRLLDSSLTLLNHTAFEIEEMNKQGFVEITDLEQIKLTLSNIKSTISTLERQIDISMRLLKFQMGMDLEQPITLTDKLNTIIDQVNPLTLSGQFDLNTNIDYKVIKTAEQLNWLLWKRERATYLPSLVAILSHSEKAMRSEFNFFDGSQDWYPSTMLGFSLDIPIFSSGMRRARVQQAAMTLDKSKITTKQVEQGLLLDYNQSKSDFMSAYDKYLSQKENLKLAESIYNRTIIKYKEGIASSMELTQVQNQYLTTQSNYLSAMFELLNAKAKVDKMMSKN